MTLTSTDFNCCKGLAHSSQVPLGNWLSSCHSRNLHPQPQFLIKLLMYMSNSNILILMETPGHHTKCTDSKAVSIQQPSPCSVQFILWMWDNYFRQQLLLLNKHPTKQSTPCQTHSLWQHWQVHSSALWQDSSSCLQEGLFLICHLSPIEVSTLKFVKWENVNEIFPNYWTVWK